VNQSSSLADYETAFGFFLRSSSSLPLQVLIIVFTGRIVSDSSYLEALVQRFLRNADDSGTIESSSRAANVSSQLRRAIETARNVHDSLSDRSRARAWRAIHGLEAAFEFPPLPKRTERDSIRRPAGRPQIVECDPARIRDPKHDVVGFVQETKTDQSVAKVSRPGTAAFATLSADLRGGPFAEMTVVDGDLIRYTFRVPMREVPAPAGALVRARILRKTSGPAPWFFSTRLWLLEIHELERPQLPVPQTREGSARRFA
jgi:hypothetical protein